MRQEFRVVYDYEKNGSTYTLPAGNGEWIPDRETAEKILAHKQERPLYVDCTLYLETREVDTPLELKANGSFNGKPVYNPDTLWWEALVPGDYVDEDVADDVLNALPPACMRSSCLQLGEPYSDRYDEEKGKWRATFLTLKKVADGVFEYCGHCFRGENKERGIEPQYI